MTTIHGEVIEFNLMTSTLGYSREHIFVYTKGKTTEDFLRCIIDTLYRLGGTPEHILTDNMTAVVSITNGSKRKHQKIRAFEKDTGMKIKLCKTRSPQTKGKDESANRFISWLNAYEARLKMKKNLSILLKRSIEESITPSIRQRICHRIFSLKKKRNISDPYQTK